MLPLNRLLSIITFSSKFHRIHWQFLSVSSTPTRQENPLDETLRANVRLLGASLGQTIAHDLGDAFLEDIETIRRYAKIQDDGTTLQKFLRSLPDSHLLPVARSFNQFLHLANIAEQHYRVTSKCVDDESRTVSERIKLIDLFKRVMKEKENPVELLFETFSNMRIDLVLTAHPTETIRRTFIQKYDQIEECLGLLELVSSEDEDKYISETIRRTKQRIKELISQAWHTNEFRGEKPTPIDGKFLFI